ncbi:THUMP-like domain-containing protein [Mycolicibacterium thermoresistibile]
MRFGLDDVAYLSSDQGRNALAEVAGRPLADVPGVAEIAALRRQFGDRTAVLVETTLLRRRAAAKFADPSHWLFTDEALQQATAAPVAEHRARRLTGRRVHDVTCSVGTEIAALRATAAQVIGSDVDPVRLQMARHNLAGDGGSAGAAVLLCRADALRPVSRDTVVVADPARRSGGRRRFDPRAYAPALDALFDVYRNRDTAVKCAPGVDFDALAAVGFGGEVEIVSLAGSVREACLWSGALTVPGVRRRATLLDRGEVVTDADPGECAVGAAGRWIVEPDGAVIRAGLVRHYAARHGLWQLDPDIAYLSGDRLPAGLRGFEVLDELPYQERRLRQALAARGVGAVEILVRGVDVDPDALRGRLRLRGTDRLAVIIARIGSKRASRARAFICRPSR